MLVSAVLWIVWPQVPDQDKAKVKWEGLFQFVKFFSAGWPAISPHPTEFPRNVIERL